MDATNLRSEVPIGARARRDQNKEPQAATSLTERSTARPPGLGTTPKHTAGRAGWTVGFRETGSFVNNPNLARWATPSERFDYYCGHRTGSEARRRGSGVGFRKLTKGLRAYPTVA